MANYDSETMATASFVKNNWRKNIAGQRYFLRDTSGGNSFGYSFDLVKQEHAYEGDDVDGFWYWRDVKKVASSFTAWMPEAKNRIGGMGAFCSAFRRDELVGVLA